MNRAIFYKEWIKTRWLFVAEAVLLLALCAYCLLNMSRLITLKGAAHIWDAVLTRDAIFIQLLRYVPLLLGLVAAVAQFAPEMMQKRLKLMLHLPCNNIRSVGLMLLFGAGLLMLLFALNLLLVWCGLHAFFAPEIVRHILLTALPWHVAGVLAYLLAAWVCLEPTWKKRVVNVLISTALLRIFFLSEVPEAYNAFLPILLVCTLLYAALPFESVARFKAGRQD